MKFIKVLSSLTFAAAMLFSATSCISVNGSESVISGREKVTGSGKIISKNVTLNADFAAISVPSIIDVIVTQDSANSVKLEGSDNLLKYCDINVSKNTLNISMSKEGDKISFKKFDVKAYVTVKNLNIIQIAGTGDVDVKGSLNTSILNLNITGTGDITIPSLKADDFKVTIAGTGDVKVKGSCNKVSFAVSGTGDIKAALTNIQTLGASVSGTGDIELTGDAQTATYSVSGTGDIEAKNMIAKTVTATASGTGDIDCYASESFSGTKSTTSGLKCYGNPANYNLTKH